MTNEQREQLEREFPKLDLQLLNELCVAIEWIFVPRGLAPADTVPYLRRLLWISEESEKRRN